MIVYELITPDFRARLVVEDLPLEGHRVRLILLHNPKNEGVEQFVDQGPPLWLKNHYAGKKQKPLFWFDSEDHPDLDMGMNRVSCWRTDYWFSLPEDEQGREERIAKIKSAVEDWCSALE